MLVLAICQGPSSGERIVALLVIAALLLVVIGVAAVVLKVSPGERRYLVGVYVVAVLVGTGVTLLGGVQDEDFGTWVALAVAAGAACGVAGLLLRGRRPLTYLLTGAAGGGTFAAGALALLLAWLAITGSCLD